MKWCEQLFSSSRGLVIIIALLAMTTGGRSAGAISRHALLVGVSHYPHLSNGYRLHGSENDLRLMLDLLAARFAFARENIRALSDDVGRSDASLLPTRANIEREVSRLREIAARGDEIVIFLAGHGSQQPERGIGTPEIDGLDEIFLPRDVKPWDAERGVVPNAIADYEIAQWLEPMQAKGARVWLIFDCCHAGDMARSAGARERSVDPTDQAGLAIPAEAIEAARRKADARLSGGGGRTRGVDRTRPPPLDLPNLRNLTVFYACQSHEKAIELPFPTDQGEAHFGLLTYALNSVLRRSQRPLSYRQLSREIYREYVAVGRVDGPTPLIEGEGADRAVLGKETVDRTQVSVFFDPADDEQRTLRIDAGLLHGLTVDSVLAVFPDGTDSRVQRNAQTPAGYVRVTDIELGAATVLPTEFQGAARRTARSLAGGRCEVVEIDHGDLRMPVYVDPRDKRGDALDRPVWAEVDKLVRDLASRPSSLVSVAEDPSQARWLLRVHGEGLVLVPLHRSVFEAFSPGGHGSLTRERREVDTELGPFAWGDGLAASLADALTRIARAENLLRLAAAQDGMTQGASDGRTVRFETEASIRRAGELQPGHDLLAVQPGDGLICRVANVGIRDFDLTVLYVNSQMGIAAVFPQHHHVNRIRVGQSRTLPPVTFTAGPSGRGHFVIIAVAARDQPTDFTWLVQPTIPRHRQGRTRLDALLENAAFGQGTTRSVPAAEASDYRFELLPVDVLTGGNKTGLGDLRSAVPAGSETTAVNILILRNFLRNGKLLRA